MDQQLTRQNTVDEVRRQFAMSGGSSSKEMEAQEANAALAMAGMSQGQLAAKQYCKDGMSDLWNKGVTGTFKAGTRDRTGMDKKDELQTVADAYSVRRYGQMVSGSAELSKFNE